MLVSSCPLPKAHTQKTAARPYSTYELGHAVQVPRSRWSWGRQVKCRCYAGTHRSNPIQCGPKWTPLSLSGLDALCTHLGSPRASSAKPRITYRCGGRSPWTGTHGCLGSWRGTALLDAHRKKAVKSTSYRLASLSFALFVAPQALPACTRCLPISGGVHRQRRRSAENGQSKGAPRRRVPSGVDQRRAAAGRGDRGRL